VKAEELRQLDAEELSGRLKGARRELYELRFKSAVGQLDNPQQIGRVRKDIARILTIVHERRLDSAVELAYGSAEAILEQRPEAVADGETPEQVEAAEVSAEAQASEAAASEDRPAANPRSGRKARPAQPGDAGGTPGKPAKDEEGSDK
jgi:large subunit ribosomal protein L29